MVFFQLETPGPYSHVSVVLFPLYWILLNRAIIMKKNAEAFTRLGIRRQRVGYHSSPTASLFKENYVGLVKITR